MKFKIPQFLLATVFILLGFCGYGQFVEKQISSASLKNIYFYNNQLGFMGGSNIFRTTDGGETWTKLKYVGLDSIIQKDQYNHKFHFFSETRGIAVATSIFSNAGTVMETTDGGVTWSVIFIDKPLNAWPYVGYTDVHFFDDQNGFAVGGEGRRIVTNDGGKTWVRRDMTIKKDLHDIFFYDATIGFISGENSILKTTDGGVTWSSTELGYYEEVFKSISFSSVLNGFAVTDDGRIYFTTDGGTTWAVYSYGADYLSSIYFLNNLTGYITGSNQNGHNVLKTTDGGYTWEELDQTFTVQLNDVYFSNAITGYVCGNNYPTTPYFGKTTIGTGGTIPRALFTFTYPKEGVFCPGGTIDFTNKGNATYNHKWYINGNLISSDYNFSHQFNEPGNYEVKLITTNNSIAAEHIENLRVDDPKGYNFDPLKLRYPSPACEQKSFIISIDNPYTGYEKYEVWSNGKDLHATTPGNPSYLVLDSVPVTRNSDGTSSSSITIKTKRDRYCYDESQDNTFTVQVVPQNYGLKLALPKDNVYCAEGSFEIKILNPLSYLRYNWANNTTGQGSDSQPGNDSTITFKIYDYQAGAGDYSVNAFSGCGTVTESFPIVRASTTADFDVAFQYDIDESPVFVNKSVGTIFIWDLGKDATPRYSSDITPAGVKYSSYGEKIIKLTTDEGHGCKSEKDTVLFITDHINVTAVPSCSDNLLSQKLPYDYTVESKTDNDGNLIVIGHHLDNTSLLHAFIRKYDKNGNLAWEKKFDSNWYGVHYSLGIISRGVTVDSTGNIYMALESDFPTINIDGTTIGSGVVTSSAFQTAVLKFSPAGNLLWSNQIYDSSQFGDNDVRVSDIEMNSKGEIFFNLNAAGQTSGTQEANIVVKQSDGTKQGFNAYNTIVKINSDGKYLDRIDYGKPTPETGYVYVHQLPRKGTSETIYFDQQPEGPLLQFDELDQLVLTGIFSAAAVPFGNITIPLNGGTGTVSVVFSDGKWVSGGSISNDNLSNTYFRHINDVRAQNDAIYISVRWNGDEFLAPAPEYWTVVNGDTLKYGTVNSYLVKMDYDGNIAWSKYFKDVAFSNLVISPMTETLIGIGVTKPVGILNSYSDKPLGFHSTGMRDGVIVEFDSSGDPITVSTFGTADDENNIQLASASCGIFTVTGYSGENSFVKTISLTNNCTPTPPALVLYPQSDMSICKNGTGVMLMPSGATSYRWTPMTGLDVDKNGYANANPVETTIYTVYGTNDGNCVASRQIKINVQSTDHDFTYVADNLSYSFTTPEISGEEYFWDFSDGMQGAGTITNHDFMQEGTYNVCLIVNNNTCSLNGASLKFCKDIVVTCKQPVIIDFLYTKADANNQVNFDATGNDVLAFDWDFGDGETSLYQHTAHAYAKPGNYKVCVKGINSCGQSIPFCKDIEVECPKPVSLFSASTVDFIVTFSNQSLNFNSWFWDFGDGSTSTERDPVHQYASTGSFTVCLKVKNTCEEISYCAPVVISCPVKADFSSAVTGYDVNFTNLSTSATSYQWSFGDQNNSTLASPSYRYDKSGTYHVCLSATGVCEAEVVCKDVIIDCPVVVADFSSIVTGYDVNFTNLSTSATSYRWSFGDQNNSTLASPSYHYDENGTYHVCLSATGVCEAEVSCKDVIIECPVVAADFTYTVSENTVVLANTSQNAVAYNWDLGDGQNYSNKDVTHEYLTSGNYSVCLDAISSCKDKASMCQLIPVVITGNTPDAYNEISVFPNPIESSFVLRIEDRSNLENVQIINMQGIPLVLIDASDIQIETTISLADRPAGTYYLKISFAKNITSKLLVKIR